MDFLAKLKLKAAADISARLAAEKQNSVEGTVLVHLEKSTVHTSNLEHDLGMVLSEQAEVRSVRPGSEAAHSRVPLEHLVYSVNGVQCCSLGDVEVEVNKPVLGVDMKLFPLAPLRDLLVQYQQLPDNEDLKFETLHRNPRYGFLQLFHPANHAWKRLYEQEKEARRQRYNLQRQLEAKKEEDALRHLEMLDVESDHAEEEVVAQPMVAPSTVPQHSSVPPSRPGFIRVDAPAAMFQVGAATAVINDDDEGEATTQGASEDDADMLHQLILGSTIPTVDSVATTTAPPPPVIEEIVQYRLTPSKTYTLASGVQVSIPVTTRIGPIPQPPSAPMPLKTVEEQRREKRVRDGEDESVERRRGGRGGGGGRVEGNQRGSHNNNNGGGHHRGHNDNRRGDRRHNNQAPRRRL